MLCKKSLLQNLKIVYTRLGMDVIEVNICIFEITDRKLLPPKYTITPSMVPPMTTANTTKYISKPILSSSSSSSGSVFESSSKYHNHMQSNKYCSLISCNYLLSLHWYYYCQKMTWITPLFIILVKVDSTQHRIVIMNTLIILQNY